MKLLSTLVMSLLLLTFAAQGSHANKHKILMVVSSHGLDKGQTQPGFEMDELAKAYLIFKQNQVQIDIASPIGGEVEADEFDPDKPYNLAFLADPLVVEKLQNTLATADVNAADYSAIFVVGGKGAMFDLPYDPALQQLIADVYQQNGSISAVCHGPAALVNVKLANGDYLVAGKGVNGFTNIEENTFGKKWLPKFDFLLEDKLKARGAIFENAPMMLPHVAKDARLITGQNPFSTSLTAISLLESMGIAAPKTIGFKDDETMQLVAAMLSGDKAAELQLRAQIESLQYDLVGFYGFQMMKNAQSDADIRQGISLMEISAPYLRHPKLALAIARGYVKLAQEQTAIAHLKQILDTNAQMPEAKQLLDQLVAADQ